MRSMVVGACCDSLAGEDEVHAYATLRMVFATLSTISPI
jgi:hypothetical protein